MSPHRSTHLDAAAGGPLHPVAREALLAALDDGWADPRKLYGAGRRAGVLLAAARESAAASLGVRTDELVFTASGVQALHTAVLAPLAGSRSPAVVHSVVEHSAVLAAVEQHVSRGGRAVPVGVDRLARVDADQLVAAVTGDTAAVVLQAANHEVGTRQPVSEVAARVRVPLVVDASQTVGHDPLPDGWAVLAGDARAWGGGHVGLLAVRTGTRTRSPFPADEGEHGLAPGVPDLPGIVAAAASLRAVLADRERTAARHHALVERLRETVSATVADVDVQGDPDDRLPHLATFSFLYVDGEALLSGLDRRGFAVSSGSSCTSSTLEPSHVLVAMGALTSGNVRVSLRHDTTDEDIDAFLAALPEVVAEVRDELGAAGL